MTENQSIPHPPLASIQAYLNARDKSVEPPKMIDYTLPYLSIVGFSSLLLFSWFFAVNPTGNARRITYEKSLPFPIRVLKLSSPFIIMLGGLYAFDKNFNWYWQNKK